MSPICTQNRLDQIEKTIADKNQKLISIVKKQEQTIINLRNQLLKGFQEQFKEIINISSMRVTVRNRSSEFNFKTLNDYLYEVIRVMPGWFQNIRKYGESGNVKDALIYYSKEWVEAFNNRRNKGEPMAIDGAEESALSNAVYDEIALRVKNHVFEKGANNNDIYPVHTDFGGIENIKVASAINVTDNQTNEVPMTELGERIQIRLGQYVDVKTEARDVENERSGEEVSGEERSGDGRSVMGYMVATKFQQFSPYFDHGLFNLRLDVDIETQFNHTMNMIGGVDF